MPKWWHGVVPTGVLPRRWRNPTVQCGHKYRWKDRANTPNLVWTWLDQNFKSGFVTKEYFIFALKIKMLFPLQRSTLKWKEERNKPVIYTNLRTIRPRRGCLAMVWTFTHPPFRPLGIIPKWRQTLWAQRFYTRYVGILGRVSLP